MALPLSGNATVVKNPSSGAINSTLTLVSSTGAEDNTNNIMYTGDGDGKIELAAGGGTKITLDPNGSMVVDLST